MKRPLAVFCLAFLLVVWGSLCLHPPEFPDASVPDGRECQVIGRVDKIEYKTIFGKEQSLLYLKQLSYFTEIQKQSPIQSENRMPKGLVCYLSTKEPETVRIGSTVLVSGVFESYPIATNPGEFDAALYYRILGLSGKLKQAEIQNVGEKYNALADWQFRLRCFLSDRLAACYPAKESGIMQTMLLGNKTELDADIRNLYRDAGILHILSVSGLHVSVLGYGMYRLLKRLGIPMRLSALLAAGWMWFYGGMIGMGVSAFRAVLMFGIRMLAKWWGRTYDLLTALAVAAALLIAGEPLYFYHSGFWLSFTCVLAISLLYPRLKLKEPDEPGKLPAGKVFAGKSPAGWVVRLANAFLLSLSVTIMTLPVFLWFYYEVSFWGLLWNLLVVPLMSVVLGGGIVNLLLPKFAEGLSLFVAKGNCLLLGLFEFFCRVTKRTGFGNVILGQPGKLQVFLFVAGMFIFLLLSGKHFSDKHFSGKHFSRKMQCIGKILLLVCLTGVLLFRRNTGFQLTFLDVGQGDGICLKNDNGNVYLIDGGSSNKSQVGTYQILPFLKQQGIRQVEAVFISHADTDHISGILELLEQQKGGVKLKMVVLPALPAAVLSEKYDELLTLCGENGTAVYTMKMGEQFRDDLLTLTCLHPSPDFSGNANAASLVLKLDFGNFSALFTGDLEGAGEHRLQQILEEQEISGIAVLKVAHHGSGNSTKEQLLTQLQPGAAVISCAENNRYGHPHKETLERLEKAGVKVFRTDEAGAIEVMLEEDTVMISGYGRNK